MSALLHAALLAWLNLPSKPAPLEGRTVLTVVILPPREIAPSTPVDERAPLPPTPAPEAPIQPPLPKPEQHLSAVPRSEPVRPGPPPSEEPPKPAEPPVVEALPADPVIPTRQTQIASKVQVLLLIGEDGKVRQIIWNQLPAVTPEELQKLEQQLREKSYLAKGRQYPYNESIELPR